MMFKGFMLRHFGQLLKGNNRMVRADYQRFLWIKPGNVDYNLMGINHGPR
tara:strand:+ start:755 stop:904 length:150 start_codon:yes stop_codon:yes gene_type:complete